jgi:serine/threonine-protein phosphatase 6 regulatory ankyrin repeat subunit B
MASSEKGEEAVVKALLDGGANPNARTKDGWTALMSAADKGHAKMAALLVESGAKTDFKSAENRTALAYAERGGHQAVIDALRNAAPAATSGSATPAGRTRAPGRGRG